MPLPPSLKIPMWIIEHDPGGGLPVERVYSHSAIGPAIGHIIMPKGMTVSRYADHMDFHTDCHLTHVASLSDWRAVQAAVNGEFGLSWEFRKW